MVLLLSPARPVDDSVASTIHGRMSQSLATEVAAMAQRLARSEVLSYRRGSSPRRNRNIEILRSGVHADTLTRMMLARPKAAQEKTPVSRKDHRLRLPFNINADSVQANLDNGVLVVRLPRVESERPRKIEIS